MSMTNEQREALDKFKHLLNLKYTPFNVGRSVLINKADIYTVLSLIKEQQEKIEGLKNKEVLIKRYFKKCDLIKQKDKQIDLMARAIDNYDSQLEINTFKDKEHIKQYFADLVEKETKET